MIQLRRSIPFVAAALAGEIAEAAAILQDAERRHGLRWLDIPVDAPQDQRAEWYETHLWPFLSETHFVLAAGDLQASGCSLVDTAGVDHSPTWRHWGEIVAEWANRFWVSRPAVQRQAFRPALPGQTKRSRPVVAWGYLDFNDYSYLSGYIADYDAWRAAVWRVLAVTGGGSVPR